MNAERNASHIAVGDHEHTEMFIAKLTRRGALGALAAFGGGLLAACGGDDDASSATTTPGTTATPSTTSAGTSPATTTATSATTGEYLDFPEETNGPFPADGSNDNGSGELASVLADSRVVRSDITTNFDRSDQQPGIPLALTMMLGSGGAALADAAVYIWHCSRDGDGSQITDLGNPPATSAVVATVAIPV